MVISETVGVTAASARIVAAVRSEASSTAWDGQVAGDTSFVHTLCPRKSNLQDNVQ